MVIPEITTTLFNTCEHFRPFLLAISCQTLDDISNPGILVHSGYGLNTGAGDWRCLGSATQPTNEDWTQVTSD